MEDDDDAPICIGSEEGEAQHRRSWESKRPHRVNVPTCSNRTTIERNSRLTLKASNKMAEGVKYSVEEGVGEGVYTSVHAALSEAFAMASGRPTVTHTLTRLGQRVAEVAHSPSSDDSNQRTNRGCLN